MRLKSCLSLLFLAGCSGFPQMPDINRCHIELNLIDSAPVCICQMYHVNRDYVGAVKGTHATVAPLSKCDKLTGFAPDEWGKLTKEQQKIFEFLKAKGL